MKLCPSCNIIKDSCSFYNHPKTKDKLWTECKECCDIRSKNWRSKNREAVNKKARR